MTVAELIAQLQTLPQDVKVVVNDECNAIFHEEVDCAVFIPENKEFGDDACVCLVVNPED